MKKLFALLVVAGMVFVSCGNKPAEEAVNEEAVVTEEVIDEQVQDENTAEVETPAGEEVVAE